MTATRPAIFPDLEGRSVFVTGGGSGIGAAVTGQARVVDGGVVHPG